MKEDGQSEKGSLRRTWHVCKEGGSLFKSSAVGSVLGREKALQWRKEWFIQWIEIWPRCWGKVDEGKGSNRRGGGQKPDHMNLCRLCYRVLILL